MTVIDSMKEIMSLGSVLRLRDVCRYKTQAQAVVKIIAGRELGLSPIESMTNIFFVNNRRALTSGIMASLVKKQEYDYQIKKLDNEECVLEFFQVIGDKKELSGESVFTIKDAAKAGLVNKDNWKNYPKNCLFARALSNGVKWFTPDAVCGYAVEEMEDIGPLAELKPTVVSIDVDGEVKNG